MRLSLVKSDGCGLGSDMFCAGHLGGETSAPFGKKEGDLPGMKDSEACSIAGKGQKSGRRKKCDG